tara:strand:+ start:35012 stop:35182 length:171 start_codon:yes stop_codon:yes gene_type:complete
MKFTIAAAALVAVGLLFMDDAASKQNRLQQRYNSAQAQDLIIAINHLNSPMPWERD